MKKGIVFELVLYSLFIYAMCLIITSSVLGLQTNQAGNFNYNHTGSVPSSPKTTTIQITDQLGRTVTFNGTPQRIVSLAPANTEILFALGLDDRVVGDTTYCNYPAAAQNISKVGGFSTPNIEAILELRPDVVFAVQIHEAKVIPQLESLGIKVVALDPKTVNEVYDAIKLVGNVTGVQEAAASLVGNMSTRINAVTNIVVNHPEKRIPNVFYVVWHDPLMTAGGDKLQSQLIELAGGKNIFDDLTGYPTVSLETVLDRNPDIIIASTGMGTGANASLNWALNESRLQVTNAYKEGKIFGINSDLTGRFGPRIVDALEEVFRLIHPDLAAKLK